MAEKAATKKRSATTRDHPSPKKSKGFTTKKKAYRPYALKVEKPSKTDDPTSIVPFVGDDTNTPSSTSIILKQPDAAELMEGSILAEEVKEQSDAANKEGSAFSDRVARVVSPMHPTYRSASLSSGESYSSNDVRTLCLGHVR